MSKNKIFIVEDNFMYSFVIEQTLKEHGNFNITTFTSAEECIQMLENNPQIIILDYNFEKGMTGFDAFNIIHQKNPKIKVIILSGQKDVQIAADLLKSGVFDYIQKQDKDKSMNKLIASILKAFDINN